MFAEIIWFPDQASTTAGSVDALLYFLVAVCGLVGLMVAFLLIWFSIRYRRMPDNSPPPPMKGNTPLELFWTFTPLGIFMVMFVWGATIYFGAYRAPDDALLVYGVGKQWMWKFQHAGPAEPEEKVGEGGQREINELHVPLGQPVKMVLISEDVIHSFFVPAFRVHMDVLPGRYTSVWFQPTRPGSYHLFCSQYCGTNHSGMIGTVTVLDADEYQRWLHYHAEGSAALVGRRVLLKYRCLSCHSADANARAPVLEELYGRPVRLRDGQKVIADEAYIRRSILDPAGQVVAGWEPIMPTFQGQVSEEEILQVIAYLKTLKKGQTPRRVEEFLPPAVTPPINPQEPKK
jgi:cytochrome c oxidase subunit 2